MLRLVRTNSRIGTTELRRVAIWGLDQELIAYIERGLRARWPAVVVQQPSDAAQLNVWPADLWICGVEPPAQLRAPTLWLGAVDRSSHAFRASDKLWKSNTPITGRQLMRTLDEIWGCVA